PFGHYANRGSPNGDAHSRQKLARPDAHSADKGSIARSAVDDDCPSADTSHDAVAARDIWIGEHEIVVVRAAHQNPAIDRGLPPIVEPKYERERLITHFFRGPSAAATCAFHSEPNRALHVQIHWVPSCWPIF